MMLLRVVPLTDRHIRQLAPLIREADRDELAAAGVTGDMVDILGKAKRNSWECWAGMAGRKCICAFGVTPVSILGRHGCPWMLGTHEIEKHARAFLPGSKRVVDGWKKDWDHLENRVDARNTKAIQWLRWLGFTIHDAEPFGPFGMPFHHFEVIHV